MKTTLLALFFLLLGCTIIQPPNTPSGKPEIVFPAGIQKQKIRDLLVQAFSNKGFEVKRADEYSILLGRRSNSLAGVIVFGSGYDGVPEMRVNISTVDTVEGVRAIFALSYVTNPGSAFEKVTDVSNWRDGQQLQQELWELKANLTRSREVAP